MNYIMENSSLYYDSKTYKDKSEPVSCYLFRNYLDHYSNSMKVDSKLIDNRAGLMRMMYEHCMKKQINKETT